MSDLCRRNVCRSTGLSSKRLYFINRLIRGGPLRAVAAAAGQAGESSADGDASIIIAIGVTFYASPTYRLRAVGVRYVLTFRRWSEAVRDRAGPLTLPRPWQTRQTHEICNVSAAEKLPAAAPARHNGTASGILGNNSNKLISDLLPLFSGASLQSPVDCVVWSRVVCSQCSAQSMEPPTYAKKWIYLLAVIPLTYCLFKIVFIFTWIINLVELPDILPLLGRITVLRT